MFYFKLVVPYGTYAIHPSLHFLFFFSLESCCCWATCLFGLLLCPPSSTPTPPSFPSSLPGQLLLLLLRPPVLAASPASFLLSFCDFLFSRVHEVTFLPCLLTALATAVDSHLFPPHTRMCAIGRKWQATSREFSIEMCEDSGEKQLKSGPVLGQCHPSQSHWSLCLRAGPCNV